MASYRTRLMRGTAVLVLGSVGVTGVGVAAVSAAPSSTAIVQSTAVVHSGPGAATPLPTPSGNAAAPGRVAPVQDEVQRRIPRDLIQRVVNVIKSVSSATWNAVVKAIKAGWRPSRSGGTLWPPGSAGRSGWSLRPACGSSTRVSATGFSERKLIGTAPGAPRGGVSVLQRPRGEG